MEKITGEEVKKIMAEHNTTYVPSRECSICHYMLAYVVYDPDTILFDAGCDCTRMRKFRNSSYDAMADHYNMQTSQEIKDDFMNKLKSGMSL